MYAINTEPILTTAESRIFAPCPAVGCSCQCATELPMCAAHWGMVSANTQTAFFEAVAEELAQGEVLGVKRLRVLSAAVWCVLALERHQARKRITSGDAEAAGRLNRLADAIERARATKPATEATPHTTPNAQPAIKEQGQ